jgi:hypothetical protein
VILGRQTRIIFPVNFITYNIFLYSSQVGLLFRSDSILLNRHNDILVRFCSKNQITDSMFIVSSFCLVYSLIKLVMSFVNVMNPYFVHLSITSNAVSSFFFFFCKWFDNNRLA